MSIMCPIHLLRWIFSNALTVGFGTNNEQVSNKLTIVTLTRYLEKTTLSVSEADPSGPYFAFKFPVTMLFEVRSVALVKFAARIPSTNKYGVDDGRLA